MQISQIATLPTKFGLFRVQAFSENGREHLAIFNGAELEAQSLAAADNLASSRVSRMAGADGIDVGLNLDMADLTDNAHGAVKTNGEKSNLGAKNAPNSNLNAKNTTNSNATTAPNSNLAQTPEQTTSANPAAANATPTNVRIHSECLTGDALGSLKCDCGAQLAAALEFIAAHGGLVLYLRQEGRGIGLFNKINAYALQDGGLDTIAANHALGFGADERDYAVAARILAHFGIRAVNLLTNNPQKITALPNVVARTPLKVGENRFNEGYLRVKKEQMGHLL